MATARPSLKRCPNACHSNGRHIKRYGRRVSREYATKREQPNNEDQEDKRNESDYDELDCCSMNDSVHTQTGIAMDLDQTFRHDQSQSIKKRNRDFLENSSYASTSDSNKCDPNSKEFLITGNGRKYARQRGPGPVVLISFILLLVISLVIVGAIIAQTPAIMFDNEPSYKSLETIHADIKKNLKLLQYELSQTREFWVTVSSNINDVVEDSPPQPSIILALVPKDSQKTATCLFHRLTEEVSLAFEDSKVLMYDGMSAKNQAHGVISHELQDFFSELKQQHTAVIHNLEKIPPESAMILHGFTDNANAPHKRALIIITLGLDLHYNNVMNENPNADRILQNLWHGVLRDVDSAAIISRIANSPVIIKPEQNYIIDEQCPY